MKKEKVVFLIIFVCLIFTNIFLIPIKSYAGLTSTSTGTTADRKTVSTAFAYCYNLRVSTSTLGDNKLDPHLMLNSDFGAALYLASSSYGYGQGKYYTSLSSSNGNQSGIYTKGKYERTAAIRENYSSSKYQSNFSNLINFKDTKYVEVLSEDINDSKNIGRAFGEISNWGSDYSFTYFPSNTDTIGIGRNNFLYYSTTNDVGGGYGTNSGNYFRPVIWN